MLHYNLSRCFYAHVNRDVKSAATLNRKECKNTLRVVARLKFEMVVVVDVVDNIEFCDTFRSVRIITLFLCCGSTFL